MTKKELKKLSRADLIEMLISQSIELNAIKEKYEAAIKDLNKQNVAIDKAGSIAEASLYLTDVFIEAEKAAQIYLQNIKLLSERQEALFAERERMCQLKIDSRINETEQKCAAMIENAKNVSQTYWDAVSKKLAEHCDGNESENQNQGN